MAKPRPCGCKGVRTCLICELEFGAENFQRDNFSVSVLLGNTYVFCPKCNDKAWSGWNEEDVINAHPNHGDKFIHYSGVFIDNFGPKCNFKKQKIVVGNFDGFPGFSKFVQDKFARVPLMKEFQTIEQCTLEYNPERGASIDPHIDDCWIWGERIVTVNVKGDSVLTMTYLQEKDRNRYNLALAPAEFSAFDDKLSDIVVRIPMPERSLLVLTGQARFQWEHRVLRDDVNNLRVCLAYREFTPPYLKGGDKCNEIIDFIFDKAANVLA